MNLRSVINGLSNAIFYAIMRVHLKFGVTGMDWLNLVGMCIMAVILIPNILFALMRKNESFGTTGNRALAFWEQIGRYGCMIFMVFNIPHTWTGFWFPHAHTVYMVGNALLSAAYLACWFVFWNKLTPLGAFLLSALPTASFLLSGILLGSIPLLLSTVIFGICHISISVKSAMDATN